MKRIIISFIMVCIVVLIALLVIYNEKTIDNRYATKYSQVLGSYDIREIDKFFNNKTKISYGGKTDTYKNLRKNVVKAIEEKNYKMGEGYSYGYGDDSFMKNTKNIGIYAYVDSDIYTSNFVLMNIKRKGLFAYEIDSISSDDNFFGYVFFGKDEI